MVVNYCSTRLSYEYGDIAYIYIYIYVCVCVCVCVCAYLLTLLLQKDVTQGQVV